MADLSELEQKGLVEAFGLQPEEVADARQNVLGFFNTLYKIDQRLKREAEARTAVVVVSHD
jgi:hypothetical protein